jgi:hypothetical protein
MQVSQRVNVTRVRVRIEALSVTIFLFCGLANPVFAQKDPIDVIAENSFLIEEAYNQEPDEVQHVFTVFYSNDKRQRGWTFVFTQEWPIFSQEHQFSYTIPSYHLIDDGARQYGIGDIELNYRYQALDEGPINPAFAPEFSLILPTGSRRKGTGDGVVGYQWTLPFSKKVTPQLVLNANFGVTYLPKVRTPLDSLGGALSPKRSLVSYIAGGSTIFAILPRFHVLLEWLGEFEESIKDNGKAEREFKPILSPGFRTAIVDEEKLQIVTGVAAPIGLNRKANNYGVFLYFSIEHHFL